MLIYGNEFNDTFALKQQGFCKKEISNFESIFAQGNGFLGVRAALEEPHYESSVRNTFISGLFNKESVYAIDECVNLPDMFNFKLVVNDVNFDLSEINAEHERVLDMRNGLISRTVKHADYDFTTERFVSIVNKNLLAQKITITANVDLDINFSYLIDGRVTNAGTQHLIELDRRIIDKKILSLMLETTQSKKLINCFSTLTAFIDGVFLDCDFKHNLEKRQAMEFVNISISQGQTLEFVKLASIEVNDCNDLVNSDDDKISDELLDSILNLGLSQHKLNTSDRYQNIKKSHDNYWLELWKKYDVKITGNDFDQLAIRFAIYHLITMTPSDGECGVGAKGLSGLGYNGHAFWDSEIFIKPFFDFTNPMIARSFINYRINTLNGAYENARNQLFEGAMFPWESASTGIDVTPRFANYDIESGRPIEVLCGKYEIHVTADVSYALMDYYNRTKDKNLLSNGGYKLVFETAKFWTSRVKWDESLRQYVINDVIGADEYTERVDNNAYTNFLVQKNFEFAIDLYTELLNDRNLLNILIQDMPNLHECIGNIENTLQYLRVQEVNSDLLIPQDDTYLSLAEFNANPFKGIGKVGSVLRDFNIEQLSKFQVGKQADVIMLFHLFPGQWDKEIVKANWHYYEERCIHDSSLSYAMYSAVAANIGETEIAYEMFCNSCLVDLCQDMNSSIEGIHAASFGGSWQAVVRGFAGVQITFDRLTINPNLPKQWSKLEFNVCWQQATVSICIDGDCITVTLVNGLMPNGQLIIDGKEQFILNGEENV